MEGWSLAVSVAAIVIALGSVWFTWQQKEIARSALELERQRHAEERKPSLDPQIEEVSNGDVGWYRLRLGLNYAWELAKVCVTIIDGKGLSFTGSQLGVDSAAPHPVVTATGGPLQPGEDLTWRVQIEDDRDNAVRLRVRCSDAEGREWAMVVNTSLPYDVLKSVH